jgi:hypothetical protein
VTIDVIPKELHPAFTLRYTSFDPSNLMSNLLHHAEHGYNHITDTLTSEYFAYTATFPASVDLFSAPHPSTELFLSSLAPLVAFLEEPTTSKFGVFTLRGLDAIASAYGRDSERYQLAAETLRATLSSALAHPTLRLVVLTAPAAVAVEHTKRGAALKNNVTARQLVSDAACFTTEDACANATAGCSGRGSCVAGRKAGKECFVCACADTKSNANRTQSWVGTSCEREDISGCVALFLFVPFR